MIDACGQPDDSEKFAAKVCAGGSSNMLTRHCQGAGQFRPRAGDSHWPVQTPNLSFC